MRAPQFFGAVIVVALLSGCATGNAGSPTGVGTPQVEPSDQLVQTSQPSTAPVPAGTSSPPVTVPEIPETQIPPSQSPDPVPATFTFNCRESGTVDYQIPLESFDSLEAVWADSRDMVCIPWQSGNTFTPVEVEAAKLALTGGTYPGVTTNIQVGVWDVYMYCAHRDLVGTYDRLPDDIRDNYRVVMRGALMVCPQHPQADQLRGL